jgi:hypothetical protein
LAKQFLLLLRSAYQALHALINAAWFGNPASWGRWAISNRHTS